MAARRWHGALRLKIGDEVLGLSLRDGVAAAWTFADLDVPTVVVSGPAAIWEQLLAPRPPRFLNDLAPVAAAGALERTGDELTYWQYYPAIARVIELLRGDVANGERVVPSVPAGTFDSPVGRYVHVDLDGIDHRIYFEEAGTGIPLLLQHTAGSHGVQCRHLFEMREITDHFRLIAYDLPFHGKSVPPTAHDVVGAGVPADARDRDGRCRSRCRPRSGSDRPAFMGCSVGGQLALDLACFHPDVVPCRDRARAGAEGRRRPRRR